jgi:dTDP-N-acetylfucosamine:lipid II N-acetylfucosaminyltransferase
VSIKVLHVGHYDKFLPKFIQFTNKEFDKTEHFFLMMDKEKKYPHVQVDNAKYISHKSIFFYLKFFYAAEKIILHGLFEKRVVFLLFLQPWLLKKVYWAIWGGDLYRHLVLDKKLKTKRDEFYRRTIISRMRGLITPLHGDYLNASKWYKAKADRYNCILYHSNVFVDLGKANKDEEHINILLGNSASKSNNHIEALEKLFLIVGNKDCTIFAPLSYGNNKVKEQVINKGKELFGDRFQPLTEFIPYEQYIDFISSIDIAIFNHKRQQAMGNIINLLGAGKKVYLNSETSTFDLFQELKVKIFDINELNLNPEFKEKSENIQIIKNYFTEQNLKQQWAKIYDSI